MLLKSICILLVIGFAGCGNRDANKKLSNDVSVSETVKLNLTELNGDAIAIEKYKGKTVFINIWATWCKPCVEEMPSIEKAQAMMNDKEVVFLLASSESIEEIKEFCLTHDYKFNYVHLKNAEALNLQALPTTFIINPKGALVFSEMGSRKWDDSTNINLIKNITTQHD